MKNIIKILVICSIFGLISTMSIADDENNEHREKLFKNVQKIIAEQNKYNALEYLLAQEDKIQIAQDFHTLVLDFYWTKKSLADALFFADAAMQFCFANAIEYQKRIEAKLGKALTDTEKEAQDYEKRLFNYFLMTTKQLSYNLASFTWTGWDEPGILITDSDLQKGLEAAKLNLRIVEDIEDDDRSKGSAYWMLGAQYLANKKFAEAIKAFQSAREIALKIENQLTEWTSDVYIALVNLIAKPDSAEMRQKFNEEIKKLSDLNTEGSKFFVEQILRAKKVFEKIFITEDLINKIWDEIILKFNEYKKLLDVMNEVARAYNYKNWTEFTKLCVAWNAEKWVEISALKTQKLIEKTE